MYPFGSLPENLAAFCRVLNRDYGFRVGPRELQDAAHALELAPLASERAVRDTLRPVLVSAREDVVAFDDAFQAFFHPLAGRGPEGLAVQPPPEQAPAAPGRPRPGAGSDWGEPADAESRREAGDVWEVEPGDADESEATAARLRARYSPLDATGPAPWLDPVDAAWREAARAFVRRIEAGRARIWRPARRGPRFDLRRTLRGSLHTSGEVLLMRWRARPRRRPRFVLLVDGSRSMSPFAQSALRLAVALAAATPNIEVFVFSTALRRITPDVRLAASGRGRQLPALPRAWGGGTSIGACFREFVRRFGERLLARHTVVIIASDGLDTGAPDVLREAMARVNRVSAGVVWLNPLIETEGYEPTAIGMRAARPYVTTFTWVENAASLRRLARTVHLRR
jgi:uncharacterized protein